VEGVGGHHSAVQVHRFQQFGEMAGLVVLDVHLHVIQQPTTVLGDAEKRTRVPWARQEVLPSTATALNRPGASALPARPRARHGSRARPAAAPAAARAAGEQGTQPARFSLAVFAPGVGSGSHSEVADA